jgi:D-serine deaminase-like pyridoxal phosphate-dependent protein
MEPKPVPYDYLETPCVLLDLDLLDANIREMTELAREAGVRLRPHTKVHQSAWIAKRQLEAGACGIEVGTIEQAEVMANEGLHDIVVGHPFVGRQKLERLRRLAANPSVQLHLVVDMLEHAHGIAGVAREVGRELPVLLKIDTGGIQRYGVPAGEPAVKVVAELRRIEGIHFAGIYGHETGATPTDEGLAAKAKEDATLLCDTVKALRVAGIEVEEVSVGASPTFRWTCRYVKQGLFPELTEIHPGNCVIGDIGYMMNGGNRRETCAITVLTSVMSVSHDAYAVLDAGVKTFGADSLIAKREAPGFFWQGMPSYGSVQGRPDLWLGRLNAEGNCIYYRDPSRRLALGERVEIVPNNATLVINIHRKLYGVRKGVVEQVIDVTGRGAGS